MMFFMFLCSKGLWRRTFLHQQNCHLFGSLNKWEFEEKQPEAILDRRVVQKNNRAVSHVLVKWKGGQCCKCYLGSHSSVADKLPPAKLRDRSLILERRSCHMLIRTSLKPGNATPQGRIAKRRNS